MYLIPQLGACSSARKELTTFLVHLERPAHSKNSVEFLGVTGWSGVQILPGPSSNFVRAD